MSDAPDLRSAIELLTDGHFSAKSAGPDAYQAVVETVRSHPDEALAEFTATFLGAAFDPQRHARVFPETLLKVLREVAPDRVRQVAESLLRHYDGVLLIYDRSADKEAVLANLPDDAKFAAVRLLQRRAQLRAMVGEG